MLLCAGLVLAHSCLRAWLLLVIRWLPYVGEAGGTRPTVGRRDQRPGTGRGGAVDRGGAGGRGLAAGPALRAGAAAPSSWPAAGRGACLLALRGFWATAWARPSRCARSPATWTWAWPWSWSRGLARTPRRAAGAFRPVLRRHRPRGRGRCHPAGGPGPGGGSSCHCGGAQFAAALRGNWPSAAGLVDLAYRRAPAQMDFGTWEGQRWKGDRARPLRPVDGGLRAASLRQRLERRGLMAQVAAEWKRAPAGRTCCGSPMPGWHARYACWCAASAAGGSGLATRRTRVRRLGEPRAGPAG